MSSVLARFVESLSVLGVILSINQPSTAPALRTTFSIRHLESSSSRDCNHYEQSKGNLAFQNPGIKMGFAQKVWKTCNAEVAHRGMYICSMDPIKTIHLHAGGKISENFWLQDRELSSSVILGRCTPTTPPLPPHKFSHQIYTDLRKVSDSLKKVWKCLSLKPHFRKYVTSNSRQIEEVWHCVK